jgi:hypothetical protein
MEMNERTFHFAGKRGNSCRKYGMNEGENREWEEEMRYFFLSNKRLTKTGAD